MKKVRTSVVEILTGVPGASSKARSPSPPSPPPAGGAEAGGSAANGADEMLFVSVDEVDQIDQALPTRPESQTSRTSATSPRPAAADGGSAAATSPSPVEASTAAASSASKPPRRWRRRSRVGDSLEEDPSPIRQAEVTTEELFVVSAESSVVPGTDLFATQPEEQLDKAGEMPHRTSDPRRRTSRMSSFGAPPKTARSVRSMMSSRSRAVSTAQLDFDSSSSSSSQSDIDERDEAVGGVDVKPEDDLTAEEFEDDDAEAPSPAPDDVASLAAPSSSRSRRFTSAISVTSYDFRPELIEPLDIQVGPGLVNLGNTCFMNSIIQCLTYTPPLLEYLTSMRHSRRCRLEGFCMFCILERRVNLAVNTEDTAIRPQDFVDNLTNIASHFQLYRQEDAHEFARYVIEGLLRSSPSKVNKKGKSVVNRIFGGYLQSQVRCCECEHASNVVEPFLDLSLEISEEVTTVHQALDHFTEVEVLDEANRYGCSECKNQVRAEKQFSIYQTPQVLTLQLKRFDFIFGEGGNKIRKHIDFPLYLELSRHLSKSLPPGAAATTTVHDQDAPPNLEAQSRDAAARESLYRLFAIVVHSGRNATSGHYYTYVCLADGWYRFDDQDVESVTEEHVLAQSAYILFYIRRPLANPSSPDESPETNATSARRFRWFPRGMYRFFDRLNLAFGSESPTKAAAPTPSTPAGTPGAGASGDPPARTSASSLGGTGTVADEPDAAGDDSGGADEQAPTVNAPGSQASPSTSSGTLNASASTSQPSLSGSGRIRIMSGWRRKKGPSSAKGSPSGGRGRALSPTNAEADIEVDELEG